jgi:adenylate cyclase
VPSLAAAEPGHPVIGPAVNLTARIEPICRQSGQQLLLSSDFVEAGRYQRTRLATFH